MLLLTNLLSFEKGAINVCDTFDMSQYDGITAGHERCACSVYGCPRAGNTY
jgi:hypothetical protein